MHTINRVFNHKTFGRIGHVEFTAPDGEYKLNGNALSTESVEFLLNFALQTFQDAYAGAADEADARERFAAKLNRVIEGTIGLRGGDGDPELPEIRTILRPDVKDAIGADEWKAMDEPARVAAIDAVFAQQDETTVAALREMARAEIARKREAAAAKKSALAGLSIKVTV